MKTDEIIPQLLIAIDIPDSFIKYDLELNRELSNDMLTDLNEEFVIIDDILFDLL